MEKKAKQAVVCKALIEKFEGANNNELLKKYSEHFRNTADMYSQFRSYLFAVAKTHPDKILKLLKDPTEIIVKSISRSVKLDTALRLTVTTDILQGGRYDKVAEKHKLSVARIRGIFMEVVSEMSKRHSLGIPAYFGKKQIIAEHKETLRDVIQKTLKKQPVKPGHRKSLVVTMKKKTVKRSSPKNRGKK